MPTEKNIYYNVHTHVFDRTCIPTQILGEKYGWLLEKLLAAKSDVAILMILQFLTIFFRNSGLLERAKMLFRAFSKGDQYAVLETLIKEYKNIDPNLTMRFVLLCQDMDCNGVDKPKKDLRAQVDEISRIMSYLESGPYAKTIIPFIGIHPDNHANTSSLMAFVKHYIEVKKFCGIKIYPAAGHYPNDLRLKALWLYCVEKNIPIMTHATCGPIYYRGKDIQERIGTDRPYKYLTNEKQIQANFTSTSNFKKLLEKHPELKLCFGHCGGIPCEDRSEIGIIQRKWMQDIFAFCRQYENVYCDISFINHSDQQLDCLYKIASQNNGSSDYNLDDKFLYGTDFYVNKHKCDEATAFKNSSYVFNMNKIASTNPAKFLTSKFFTFHSLK
ncbi:MAG: amidohydrolase family protein [Saprospiraceae bacterium]